MKLNKSAYLFAAALVAGTVGMTSCSSEDVIDATEQGVENKVTLALSVADKFGTRSSADQVNLGSNLQKIQNVVIVPMIDKAYLNPVVMGNLDPASATDKTIKKTASLNSNINYFKVYGNVDASNFDATKVFTGFNLTVGGEQTIGADNNKTVYAPHGLYYYGYAGTSENQIKVGESEGSYSPLKAGDPISSNKYIQLEGVNYAVGVLAAAVFNGDTEACIYDNKEMTGDPVAVTSSNVTVTGIVIDGQKKTLDQDFNAVGSDLVSVYETATKTDFATAKVDVSKAAGNIYCVVTETGNTKSVGGTVSGNIEFTLAAGKYLKLNDNTVIGDASNATKFYLPFTLAPTDSKAVFMKDYSTFFNATVKDWGLASKNPVEVTDANIAVTVDMEWETGIVYDQDI